MPCIIAAGGRDFDVDAFLVECTMPVTTTARRGRPRFPNSKSDSGLHEYSSIQISISDADFDNFDLQVAHAIAFLVANVAQLERLCRFPNLEEARLDFGIYKGHATVHCDYLPPELVRAAGAIGLGIEISHYPFPSPS
jgi:hypothetical protein